MGGTPMLLWVALRFLCEGKIMKRYLLITALVLTTVWATGCIIIDAGKMESRKPATTRSEECVIRQSLAVDTLAVETDSHALGAIAEP
jgi:hypothetical protein